MRTLVIANGDDARAGLAGALLAVAVAACAAPAADAEREHVVVATTTSLADTGLLDSLRMDFERVSARRLRVISVGSGAALALGRRGEADVLLVHSPADEERFVRDGFAAERLPVMHNDFVIVGPPDDPARVRLADAAVDALRRVAASGVVWVERDDASGTDVLSRSLRASAGVGLPPERLLRTGQGMGTTLRLADARAAYTLSDRATYVVLRRHLVSVVLFAGDPVLANPYSVIVVAPDRFPAGRIRTAAAFEFARFLTGPEARARIERFGTSRYGEPPFRPGAPPPRRASPVDPARE